MARSNVGRLALWRASPGLTYLVRITGQGWYGGKYDHMVKIVASLPGSPAMPRGTECRSSTACLDFALSFQIVVDV